MKSYKTYKFLPNGKIITAPLSQYHLELHQSLQFQFTPPTTNTKKLGNKIVGKGNYLIHCTNCTFLTTGRKPHPLHWHCLPLLHLSYLLQPNSSISLHKTCHSPLLLHGPMLQKSVKYVSRRAILPEPVGRGAQPSPLHAAPSIRIPAFTGWTH